ncbi:Avirulence (Avh) protein [Phytophthora megakarya]|uniref:Avirulence (Avh) protein n=1 Tax=Phytophthora megakarya TaxID=4795 RepID=A0A225X5B0_9STRA|nr:Avirulence (Avh) protein [Phytophthora megakarya]
MLGAVKHDEKATEAAIEVLETSSRLLRIYELTDGAHDNEERGVVNLTKRVATWMNDTKLAQIMKAWIYKMKMLNLLRQETPRYDTLYKMGVNPDDIYKVLNLKKSVLQAWDTARWAELKRSAKYQKWRHYQNFWNAMNKQT